MYSKQFYISKLNSKYILQVKSFKERIDAEIKKKGFTKDLIYRELGMSRQGFEYALKNDTIKLSDFDKIAKLLAIDLNKFFGVERDYRKNLVEEPKGLYNANKKNDTKTDTVTEVDFLREQVKQLTGIIEVLSRQIDTNNINK